MKEEISANRTFLMGLAMIAVVCFHHGWTVIPGFTAVFSRFGLWGVDIFLFLSGFGCVYALNKYTVSTFFRKRIVRLLPTCLLAGVLIYCVDFYFHAERTLTYIPIRLLSVHRWYIQAILICYSICPLAYVVLKRFRVSGLLGLVALAILIEHLLPEVDVWKINWAFGRMPVFLIGMYIAMFDFKMSRWQYMVSCVSFVLAVVTRCGGGYYGLNWTYFLAAAMPFVCETMCRLRNICTRLKIYHIVELFGVYSLEIYLIHEYFFWALYEIPVPLWSKYVMFIIIVFGLCFAVKWTADICRKTLSKVINGKAENLISR